MVEKMKWYRVIDPLNPLHGCDVKLSGDLIRDVGWALDPEDETFYRVVALRRLDIFVGDRPYQLVAKEGNDLGLLISNACFAPSPVQDEVVVTGTDRPHGICIDESEMTRRDGVTLRIARYERAVQMALEDADNQLLATQTMWSGGLTGPETVGIWEQKIVSMFERGDDQDDIAYVLRENT